MNSYNKKNYGSYNNYQPGHRRNSNSLNEEQSGGNRKKPRWSNKNRGGVSNVNIDTPLFKEPPSPTNRSPRGEGSNRYNASGSRDNPFRTQNMGMGSKPQFNTPHFVDPQHLGTSWNWENYMNDCINWQEKHKLAYYKSRCMALEFENQMLFQQITSLIDENCVFAAERGETPTMRLPEILGKQGAFEKFAPSSSQPPKKKQGKNRKISTPSDTDSDLEFEISEDMMAFLEKSIRHKLSLRKKKNEGAATKKMTDAEMKKKDEDSKKPKLPVGLKRKEELDLLYGNNSTVIHGLETSVQLNFNRNCDTFKPEMWMAVPLNPQAVA